MNPLIGHLDQLPSVAEKSAVLFAIAVAGFRLAKRRTMGEFAPFDFVTAIATGAIVGRTATSADTSVAEGVTALVVLLVLHTIVARLRFDARLAGLFNHRPRLLVVDGKVRRHDLHKTGLTDSDLDGLLRQHGLRDLSEARYVIFEEKGQISVVRQESPDDREGLLSDVVAQAVDTRAVDRPDATRPSD